MKKNVVRLNEKKSFLAGHERELFDRYYVLMGPARSTIKLVEYCVSHGWLNPRTGKAPTRMGCWFSMWRWALRPENQEDAYQMYQKSLLDEGLFCTKEAWKELLQERAIVCLEHSVYMRWKQHAIAG